jgi:Uma2 family endonuclease
MHPVTESPKQRPRGRYNDLMNERNGLKERNGREPEARPLAGWAEIEAAPEGLKAEVLGGELFLMPRPRVEHGHVQANLAGELSPPFGRGRGGPGGWFFAVEPDLRFSSQDIVSPDLAGWRRERMPELPSTRPIDLVPDWVCEVLSPSTAARDRRAKADLYLRDDVAHYWLADPSARLLEALEAREGRWTRLGAWGDGDLARVPPFEAVELAVGAPGEPGVGEAAAPPGEPAVAPARPPATPEEAVAAPGESPSRP